MTSDVTATEAGVFHYDDARRLREHALVLLARGVPFSVEPEGTGGRLRVPADVWAELAQNELGRYDNENASWPDPEPTFSIRTTTGFSVPFFVFLLWMAFELQINQGSRAFYESHLAVADQIILKDEWHRAFGSLFLHADLPHLLGNLLAIALFAWALLPLLGSGLVWAGFLLSGFLGNWLNAFFFHVVLEAPAHRSLGASTASFGLMGLASGWRLAVALRGGARIRWRRLLPPIGVAAAFLALLGSSEKTDVSAHLFGLVAGAAIGMVYGFARLEERLTPGIQRTITATLFLGVSLWLTLNSLR